MIWQSFDADRVNGEKGTLVSSEADTETANANEKKTFTCPHCHKLFKIKKCYDTHIKRHGLVFKCHICGKIMANKNYLKQHVDRHLGEGKTYNCDQCEKAYTDAHNLRMHKDISHGGGEKNQLCRFCPSRFFRRGDMKKHERTHTKEKPYACRVVVGCERRFTSAGNRNNHELTHGTRNPEWPCDICGKLYLSRVYRDDHVKIQHAPPTVPCPHACGKMFRRKQKAKAHGRICPIIGNNKLVIDDEKFESVFNA